MLPTEIGRLTGLKTSAFSLVGNEFTGPLPTELGYLTAMTDSFTVQDNSFDSALPTELGQLVSLKSHFKTGAASLSNKLDGQIPTQLGRLTSLTDSFDMRNGKFVGTIPTEISLLSEGLATGSNVFDLSGDLVGVDVWAVTCEWTTPRCRPSCASIAAYPLPHCIPPPPPPPPPHQLTGCVPDGVPASGAKLFPTSCPVYFGLTALYKAAGGASIDPVLTGWMNDCDPCDATCPQGGRWQGLTCQNAPTPSGVALVVTRVELRNKKLAGYLPSQVGRVELISVGNWEFLPTSLTILYHAPPHSATLQRTPPPDHSLRHPRRALI